MPYRSPEDAKARQHAYTIEHRDEIAVQKKAYYEANRDEIRAKAKARRGAHREEIAARGKVYRAVRPDKIAAKNKEYHAANRVELTTKNKKYRATHREEITARRKAYNAAHRDEIAVKNRAYFLAHPDKVRAAQQTRRARQIANGGTHTAAEWRALRDWFGNMCVCCGATTKLSKDHVVPLVAGGSDAIENLQPLCKPCNNTKHTKTLDYRNPVLFEAFLQQAGKLVEAMELKAKAITIRNGGK